MRHLLLLLLPALLLPFAQVHAQQVSPPPRMADELCDCLEQISMQGSDRDMDLAVRLCLNNALAGHSGEVVELLRRYPAQDRQFYLLGQLLGGTLDRTCPRYAVIKERLFPKLTSDVRNVPST